MQRRLGSIETAWALTSRFAPLSVAGVLHLRGAPTVERLREVLHDVQERQPLLRARIVGERRRLEFDVSPNAPAIGLEVFDRCDDEHWIEVATDVLNREVDPTQSPLLQCTYLRDSNGDAADLVFAYHHSIMDASSAIRLCDEILTRCKGDEPADASQPRLIPPIEDLLPERLRGWSRARAMARFVGRQASDELSFRRGTRGRAETIAATANSFIVNRSLDADATADLVSRARRRRITTNSAMAAALLLATHRQLHPDQSLPMRTVGFADLRPSLEPPPPIDLVGCYFSMVRFTVPVDANADLWTVAQLHQDRSRESRAHDEHFLSALVADRLVRLTLAAKRFRLASTALSYAGTVGLAERYGDIEVAGFDAFISNNRLGPHATAFAKLFGGRLSWNFVFNDSDFDTSTAEHIADDTIGTLIEAAA